MNNIQQLKSVKKFKRKLRKLDKRQRLRYGLMIVGILAFAPPVAFIPQLFGNATICGNLCPRMAIGTSFTRELFMRTGGVALLFIWLTITFFWGRWMCSHICPAGNLTEFGSKLIPGRFKIDYGKIVDTPLFRYGFLAAYILLPVVGISSICCSFCSFSVIPEFFGMFFTPRLADMLASGTRLISVILFVFVLGIFARDGRGHCHMICPVGALDSIVNVLGSKLPFTFRERVNQSKCTGCGFCATNCPISAITVDKEADEKVTIDHRRCYQCRSCESNCPTNAIYYGKLVKEEDIWHEQKVERLPVLD